MGKYSYNEHFLDSNILLGWLIPWDYFNSDCHKYFEEKWSRNISKRVYDECEKVISRYRRLQGVFLEAFGKYAEGINQDKLMMSFDAKFNKFVNSFIRKKLNQNNTFDLPKTKFRESVINFTNECKDLIRNALINSSYPLLLSEVRYCFNDAIEQLEIICYDLDIVKVIPYIFEGYNGHYPQYENMLKEIGIHRPDDRILLDCYYFRETEFNEDIAFITKDKNILDANSEIEHLLKGIYIHTI